MPQRFGQAEKVGAIPNDLPARGAIGSSWTGAYRRPFDGFRRAGIIPTDSKDFKLCVQLILEASLDESRAALALRPNSVNCMDLIGMWLALAGG